MSRAKVSRSGAGAEPLLDSLGEAYDAACEGSAFYALQSCCNHSCAPNAHAFKRAGLDTDGSAVVLAKRAIATGDEVSHIGSAGEIQHSIKCHHHRHRCYVGGELACVTERVPSGNAIHGSSSPLSCKSCMLKASISPIAAWHRCMAAGRILRVWYEKITCRAKPVVVGLRRCACHTLMRMRPTMSGVRRWPTTDSLATAPSAWLKQQRLAKPPPMMRSYDHAPCDVTS